MKTYDVTITARVTKTIRVQAESEDDAIESAHAEFSASAQSGLPERYNEETDRVVEVNLPKSAKLARV